MECDEPFKVEKEIKKRFNMKFKLIAGKEYFEGDEHNIKKEFNDIVSKFVSTNDDTNLSDDEYFKFISEGVSIYPLLQTTKALFNPPVFENLVSTTTVYEVNCRDNFNKEEIKLIKKNKILSLENLLRCDGLNLVEQVRALKCYKYVMQRYELTGIEPFNGTSTITIGKYMFLIKISIDRSIKYILSCGIKKNNEYNMYQLGMK